MHWTGTKKLEYLPQLSTNISYLLILTLSHFLIFLTLKIKFHAKGRWFFGTIVHHFLSLMAFWKKLLCPNILPLDLLTCCAARRMTLGLGFPILTNMCQVTMECIMQITLYNMTRRMRSLNTCSHLSSIFGFTFSLCLFIFLFVIDLITSSFCLATEILFWMKTIKENTQVENLHSFSCLTVIAKAKEWQFLLFYTYSFWFEMTQKLKKKRKWWEN